MNYSDDYLYWLTQEIALDGRERQYRILLSKLFETAFIWDESIRGDGNRAKDGYMLRQKFENNVSIDDPTWDRYLPVQFCSVLEMLIALAQRCEDSILFDPDYGDRSPEWFWMMLDNSGLGSDEFKDRNFNSDRFYWILDSILHRRYSYNGIGSFFPMKNSDEDMREVEIWYQLNNYIWERGL